MKCPFCGNDNTRVIDSRPADDNFSIRRRRLPVSVDQISHLIDEVETEIFNMEEKEIPSNVIGELVMDKLREIDAVAYVRFASVYREFKDVNTFMNELKKMLDK